MDCPFHYDHENRIKNLEGNVKDLQKSRINPAVWVALISLCGTLGSALAQVIIAVFVK
jgi:hypothetical protein